MPTELSIVVHGPNTQGHLTGLLDSVAADPAPDTEVIVVAVGDWARETAREHAPGAVLVALPDGTGDAEARAAGAARASGRWLHFVHAKDGLPPGAPALLAARAAELPDTVDVLLFDHVRTTWQTSGAPSYDSRLLARAGRAELTLDDLPALLRLTPILGNRLIRADHWRAHADTLSTDDEAYAAQSALLTAARIACYTHPGFEHRELRPGSLPPRTLDDHLAVLDRYEALLEATRTRTAPHAVLYHLMVRDGLRTFVRAGMPERDARVFFHRASQAARRLRPEGLRHPAGPEGLRRTLLEEDAYARYRALQTANHARRAAKKALRTGKRQLGTQIRSLQYRRALSRPVDPNLAVFSAYWNRGVACNPAAIAAKLAELAPQVHPVWVVAPNRVGLLPPGTDHVVPDSRRYWEVLGRAKFLVNNVNFANAVVKRPDAVHVQTHHGTPLKRMGIDQMRYPATAQGLDFEALLARIDKWDYSVSANSHTTRMWESAYPSRYVSLDHGYPRNDVYYTATAADIAAIRARLGIAPGRRAILYAPTHRDYEAEWTPRLDLAALADRLGEETVLLVRSHYFHAGTATALTGLRRAGRVLDVSAYEPVEELCLAADALITDYSSIMFDYANLDRPIVIHADDWETYVATRGVYFDLMAEAPGPVARTQGELVDILTSDAWNDHEAGKARAMFRRRFCEFDDGRAAERVVRRVFLGEPEEALPAIIPVDERTPAPTPQEATAS
ncbi:CDP-glycerol glycerophosphotransferase family protein [Streptomyces sp. NPDC052773]|uniref:CDP-glycerol glycerophosphotransferase family protein n=1 Tax=Streptomyces sp. NPDC052773 TaxID=3365693 RepID=UPI0037D4D873